MKPLPGNAQHIGTRSEQQDSFGFSDPEDRTFVTHAGIAAVVADGMGGLANGGAASAAAVREFLEAYHAKEPTESIPDALLRAIHTANRAVTHLWRTTGARDNLGTTLAAVVIHEDWLYWISAGDSRVYLYREGSLTRLTNDHVYAADLEEQVAKRRITREQAMNDPQRDALTSYLGLETLPRVDRSVHAFPVQPGDCVLVCSDGLYRSLSEEEILAGFEKDAHKTCENLIDRAVDKHLKAQDNITVVALKCRPEKSPARRIARALAAAAILAILAAGGYGFRRSQPEITQFSVDHTQIQAGQAAVIGWSAGRGKLTISPGIGAVDQATGRRSVSPQQKTTYTLTARNFLGSTTRSVVVDVVPATPVPDAPIIASFEAVPAKIARGSSALLKWSIQHSQTFTIQPAIHMTNPRPEGSVAVTPTVTTTYILKATAGGKSAVAKASVSVVPAPTHPVRITSFTVDQAQVPAGGSATLTWKVSGQPVALSIDQGIGAVKAADSRKITLAAKTTYRLTAVANGGAAVAAEVTVDVIAPPGIDKFAAIWDGQNWRLNWTVSGAQQTGTKITIQPDIGVVSPASPPDGLVLKSPTADRYTITAVGPGGTASKDAPLQPAPANP